MTRLFTIKFLELTHAVKCHPSTPRYIPQCTDCNVWTTTPRHALQCEDMFYSPQIFLIVYPKNHTYKIYSSQSHSHKAQLFQTSCSRSTLPIIHRNNPQCTALPHPDPISVSLNVENNLTVHTGIILLMVWHRKKLIHKTYNILTLHTTRIFVPQYLDLPSFRQTHPTT